MDFPRLVGHAIQCIRQIQVSTKPGEVQLVALADDRWTTRALRDLEQRTLRVAGDRAREAATPISEEAIAAGLATPSAP